MAGEKRELGELKTTIKTVIMQEVIKNLLSAHRRIAEHGSAREVIRISRYLMRLAEKRGNVLIEPITIGECQRSENPINELADLN